jgi:Trypsin
MGFDFLPKALKTSRLCVIASSGVLRAIASSAILTIGALTALEINHRAEAIVVPGNPNDYTVSPGTGYDGVVRLDIGTNLGVDKCSGSLLPTGLHILTAAHCLTDDFGANITNAAAVSFELTTGTVSINVPKIFIHPEWGGFADIDSFGADIAILELASIAPQAAERYDIYRNTDEIGQVSVKVGYGDSGQGNSGSTIFDGFKRFGQNRYDAVGEILSSVIPVNILPGTLLAYDFDNGQPENDAFGVLGIPDLGLGLQEVNTAPGDSGGPTFINGLIAGVTSGGTCLGFDFINFGCSSPPDIDNVGNSSFGEIGIDTRVSTYASYVDDVLAGKVTPTKQIPEPNTIFGTVFALGAFGISSRFKKKAISS